RSGRVTATPRGRLCGHGGTVAAAARRYEARARGRRTVCATTVDPPHLDPLGVARKGVDRRVDELPIGRRVAYWRSRRRMSQQVFADRLGKSKSWVDKVERGVRRLDKFSLIHDIAEVLQVDPHLLLERDPEPPRNGQAAAGRGVDQVEIAQMRAALERYDQLGTLFAPP